MQKNESLLYWGMLGLSFAFGVLAVVTLIPNPLASKPNVLGYRSVCSFSPASTALCGLLAGITCTLRNRRVSRAAASMRYRPLILPIGVGLVLLIVALVFGIRFGNAQARFGTIIAKTRGEAPTAGTTAAVLAEGTRSTTVTEGDISATVEVTVQSGSIASMSLKAGKNVEPSVAEVLFERVKAAGSTAVDAVSGATATSRVLLEAIGAAAAGEPIQKTD